MGNLCRWFPAGFKEMNRFCNQPWRQKIRNKVGIQQLFGQVAADFFIIQPFVYWPVFYMFKTYVDVDNGASSTVDIASSALEKYSGTFWQDNLGMCAFWLPADIIIYSVPVWLRLPLNHGISFVWCSILSFWRGGEKE